MKNSICFKGETFKSLYHRNAKDFDLIFVFFGENTCDRAKNGEGKSFVGASEAFCEATIEMAPKERNIAMMGYRSVGECDETARTARTRQSGLRDRVKPPSKFQIGRLHCFFLIVSADEIIWYRFGRNSIFISFVRRLQTPYSDILVRNRATAEAISARSLSLLLVPKIIRIASFSLESSRRSTRLRVFH